MYVGAVELSTNRCKHMVCRLPGCLLDGCTQEVVWGLSVLDLAIKAGLHMLFRCSVSWYTLYIYIYVNFFLYIHICCHSCPSINAIGPAPLRGGLKNINRSTMPYLVGIHYVIRPGVYYYCC
jgi:hypothetical protein